MAMRRKTVNRLIIVGIAVLILVAGLSAIIISSQARRNAELNEIQQLAQDRYRQAQQARERFINALERTDYAFDESAMVLDPPLPADETSLIQLKEATDQAWKEAMIPISKALSIKKDDSELLWAFAQARANVPDPTGKHIREPINYLRTLLRYRPNHEQARKMLLHHYNMIPGQFLSETKELAEEILEDEPSNTLALHAMAQTLAQEENIDEALDYVDRWLELEPLELEPRSWRIELMRFRETDPQHVIEYAQDVVNSYPDEPKFKLLLARAYRYGNQPEKMGETYDAILETDLKDLEATWMLIRDMESLGRFSESMRLLTAASEQWADDNLRAMLIQRHWQRGNYHQALALIEQMHDDPAYASTEMLGLHVLTLLETDGTSDKIQPLMDELERRMTGDEAALHVNAGDWHNLLNVMVESEDDARNHRAIIEETNAGSRVAYFHFLRGEAYEALEERQMAIQSFRRAAELQPTWPAPFQAIARLSMNAGQQANIPLAAQAARRAFILSPDDLESKLLWAQFNYRMLMMMQQQQQEEQRVQLVEVLGELIREMQEDFPSEDDYLPLAVAHLIHQEKNEEAGNMIMTWINSERELSESTLVQFLSFADRYELAAVEPIVQRIQADYGNTPQLAWRTAMRQLRDEQPIEQVLSEFDATRQSSDAGEPLQWDLLRAQLAAVESQEESAKHWVALVRERNDSVQALRLAIDNLMRIDLLQHRETIDQAIRRLRALTTDDAVAWRMARARWNLGTLSEVDPEDTEEILSENTSLLYGVLSDNDDMFEAHLLLTESLRQLGEMEEAIESLRNAKTLRPSQAHVRLNLAMMLFQQGNMVSAQQELDEILNSQLVNQLNPSQLELASELLLNMGQEQRAAQLLEPWQTLAEDQRNNPQMQPATDLPPEGAPLNQPEIPLPNQVLMAQIRLQSGQVDEAITMLNRLIEDQGPSAQSLSLLARAYAMRGDMERAEQQLARLDTLEDLVPGQAPYTKAMFHLSYNNVEAADAAFAEATQAAPDRLGVWLEYAAFRFRTGQGQQVLDELPMIRQRMSQIDDQEQAKQIIDQLIQHQKLIRVAVDNNVMGGIIAAMIGQPDQTEAVVQVLELYELSTQQELTLRDNLGRMRQLADRFPKFLELQNMVTRMYAAAGEFDNAASLAMRSMQNYPMAVTPAEEAARMMAMAGRYDEAMALAEQWRDRSHSASYPADLFIARLHLQQDQPEMTQQLIDPYLEEAKSRPQQMSEVLVIEALARVAQGQVEQAAELLRPHMQSHEGWKGQWLQIAIQQLSDRNDQARWLIELEENIDADQVRLRVMLAEAWMAFSAQHQTDEGVNRASEILKRLTEDNPDSAPAMTARAMQYERLREPNKAIAAYRASLAIDSDQAVANNNLAMLLLNRPDDDLLDEAYAMARKAVELEPNSPHFHDTLALIAMQKGQTDQAMRHINRAIELNPNDPTWQVQKVQMLIELKRMDQAQDAYVELQQLVRQFPQVPEALQTRMQQLEAQLSSATTNNSTSPAMATP